MEMWQRNLYAISFAELVAISGFGIVLPFLPFYVQELGVTEPTQVVIWSALALASNRVTMAIFAPIWGLLADRYGRKPMLIRAMLGGALVMPAMAFVQNVEQLVLLRGLQGCLSGTIAAGATLVASTVPRQRYGYAMGFFQTARFSAVSVGPMLGGIIADAVGLRSSFLVTGALLAMAVWPVAIFVHEDVRPGGEVHGGIQGGGIQGFLWPQLKLVFSSRPLMSTLGLRMAISAAARMLNPVLPLVVQSLVPGARNVATTAGLIMGVSGVGSALGALGLGRISDRVGLRLVLILSTLGAAATYFPQFFVTQVWQLLILQVGTGVALGGTVATLGALLASVAPEEAPGVAFGIDASATSIGRAVAPLAGGAAAAHFGLRSVFLCTGVIFALTGLGMISWCRTRGSSDDKSGF